MNFKTRIRRYFITGIVVLLPIFLTINILSVTARFLDNLLGRFIQPYIIHVFGVPIFGAGLLAIIILIFITGVLATNVFIKRIMPFFERLFLRIPLVYQIYPAVKQLVRFLFGENKLNFKKVVLFEYPRKGLFSIGFITNEFSAQLINGQMRDTVCVYVSFAPNPITGFFVIVPKNEVTILDITIEEAFKIIVSGGVLMQPETFSKTIKSANTEKPD